VESASRPLASFKPWQHFFAAPGERGAISHIDDEFRIYDNPVVSLDWLGQVGQFRAAQADCQKNTVGQTTIFP
jgi:hypothetical protein